MGLRVLLFGATGMVGQGVLRECLRDPGVEKVLAVGRSPSGGQDPKLEDLVREDLADLGPVEPQLRGYNACFFCLGVSSVGRTEAEYRRVTYDLTVAIARVLVRASPDLTFVYVSGVGTDSTERGRTMWARVKGATENALLEMGFRAAYMFRPGVIRPLHGIRSRTAGVRIVYAVLFPVVWLVGALAPNSITTTENVGRAMIHVAERGAPTTWLKNREINQLAK